MRYIKIEIYYKIWAEKIEKFLEQQRATNYDPVGQNFGVTNVQKF